MHVRHNQYSTHSSSTFCLLWCSLGFISVLPFCFVKQTRGAEMAAAHWLTTTGTMVGDHHEANKHAFVCSFICSCVRSFARSRLCGFSLLLRIRIHLFDVIALS